MNDSPARPRHVRPVRAVVFDLFRTLVSPELVDPSAFQRVRRLAEALSVDEAPLARWYAETRVDRNRHATPTFAQRLSDYCAQQGTPRPRAKVEAALDVADRFHSEAIRFPPEEVTRTLSRLRERGFKVGVLSNTDEHEIRAWRDSPIAGLVDAVALSVEIGFVKPEPEAYAWVLNALGGVPPQDAVFVGDGESRELVGAKSVGFREAVFMRGFVAHTGFQTPENIARFELEADRTVDSIPEVLEIVEDARAANRESLR